VAESLSGKVALVTGAIRGIGRAIARDLAVAGAHVVGVARRSAELTELGRELADAISAGQAIPADVGDAAAVRRVFDEVDERFRRLDILVNNAGVAVAEPFLNTNFETWRRVCGTNVDALFLVTQAALQPMLAAGRGDVVFIASDAAIRGIARMAPYCASKHAVLGFARALAAELGGSGIRVTTVMPGPVNTTILSKRADRADLIQPEDVAATVRQIVTLPARAEVKEILLVPHRQS
jgi:NADP-dependent 3-hydroxy acid dehydrogenase YdfG